MKVNEIINKSKKFDQKNKKLIKESGVVFTDREICDRIISLINPNINDIICEPSVGKGVFVFSLLEFFMQKYKIEEVASFFNEKLYCFDINNDFLSEFKQLVIEYFNIYGFDGHLSFEKILNDDFLIQDIDYDVIIGNPPYVRIQNIEKEYLDRLKKELKSVSLGNIDLYYAFLEKSLLHSKKVGFIIPNSWIKNKSGSFIREILKDRIDTLIDFKNHKVWDKISTYTSIVICNEIKTDHINYQTKDIKINKSKSELGKENWIFEDLKCGNNKISGLVNYYSGGLATIKDDVFKVNDLNENLCTKNNFEIEKSICKKYIKATTSRSFEEYNWIIYPYDEDGRVISEENLINNFPLCYRYLKHREQDLLSRDKGKTENYDSWYSYGRRQGLIKPAKGKRVILPLTFLRKKGIHIIEIPNGEDCLTLSGILVDVKFDKYDEFKEIINSDEFYKYCELNNKILSDKDDIWLSITTTTIKNFTF